MTIKNKLIQTKKQTDLGPDSSKCKSGCGVFEIISVGFI